MGRKKEQTDGAKPAEQILHFVPEQPQAPPPPAQAPPAALAPPLRNDQAKIESPEFLEKVRVDAIQWAKQCGLKPPFTVNGPERVAFPREGHGYVVTLREETGKQRLGSARFNSKGASTHWSLDGIVTG